MVYYEILGIGKVDDELIDEVQIIGEYMKQTKLQQHIIIQYELLIYD
jgi:hypothetical protein